MTNLIIDGDKPLSGSVTISGAKNSALKLIHAAMFLNEDVIIDNVPRIENVTSDLEVINSVGGSFEWLARNKIRLNGSAIDKYEVPFDIGSKYRTAGLLAAPLLYRFGKAVIPKPGGCRIGPRPINRWIETWETLGISVTEETNFFRLTAGSIEGKDIHFKVNTHTGTDNAILSALFVDGETVITNAAEEPEIDDLIAFSNLIGGEVERVAPRKIVIRGKKSLSLSGSNVFKTMCDRNEAVTFAVAALVTNGNITITGADKNNLLAFTNVLTKAGCDFEFGRDEMRIWRAGGKLAPVDVITSPAPGFMTDWQPLITLLLTCAEGTSLVHDTVYTDRFEYIKDLNRMGAKIELLRPSSVGLEAMISDDGYDLKGKGEPYTVARIHGSAQLKGTKLHIPDLRAGATLVLAALSAHGKSEVFGYENVERGYESFVEKLISLGARIEQT